MNSKLLRVLRSAGAEPSALKNLGWQQVILTQNEDAIPGCADGSRNSNSRGFNLVLLGRDGLPSHYCKCRPEHDPVLQRETRILKQLWHDPTLRDAIPEAKGAAGEGIQIQLALYTDGVPYSQLIPRLGLGAWERSVVEISAVAQRVSRGAIDLPGDGAPGPAAPIDLHAAAAEPLDRLREGGLDPDAARLLAAILRAAAPVNASPQHGDLWPPNIVRERTGWRLLDFEFFGVVRAPLYDICHLLQTSSAYRAGRSDGHGDPMLGLVAGDRPEGRVIRDVLGLAAKADGLRPAQVAGVVVFYIVDIAARISGRSGPPEHVRPLLHRVRHVAELVRQGTDLGSMLTNAAP